MSLTALRKEGRGGEMKRVVTIGSDARARRVVVRFRWNSTAEGGKGRYEMAAAPVGRRRARLRWRPLKAVLEESFGLAFPEEQLTLQEVNRE